MHKDGRLSFWRPAGGDAAGHARSSSPKVRLARRSSCVCSHCGTHGRPPGACSRVSPRAPASHRGRSRLRWRSQQQTLLSCRCRPSTSRASRPSACLTARSTSCLVRAAARSDRSVHTRPPPNDAAPRLVTGALTPQRLVQFSSSIRENISVRGMGMHSTQGSQATLGLTAMTSRCMLSMEVPRAPAQRRGTAVPRARRVARRPSPATLQRAERQRCSATWRPHTRLIRTPRRPTPRERARRANPRRPVARFGAPRRSRRASCSSASRGSARCPSCS